MNKLFLTAILGEMCLDYSVGLKVGRYSPFKLFKQQCAQAGLKVTGNKVTCILTAINIQQQNNLRPHTLADKAIGEMLNKGHIKFICSGIKDKALYYAIR